MGAGSGVGSVAGGGAEGDGDGGGADEPVGQPVPAGVITRLVTGPPTLKVGVDPQIVRSPAVFEKLMFEEARKVSVLPDGTLTVMVVDATVIESASDPETATIVV